MCMFSGFNYAALVLTPYASRGPYGTATQCSLPSGCQPLSGGSFNPLGIDYMFHSFRYFLMYCLLARLTPYLSGTASHVVVHEYNLGRLQRRATR